MDIRGEPRQQGRELLGGLGGAQLVHVVDDQDEGLPGRGKLGQHLVHHGLAVEPGRRGRGLGAASGCADRAQQGEPEQLRVVLRRLY
jgi:GNAT superfamily N-acetyltransferase